MKRIDGLVPAEEDRTDYANIFGEALDEVLSYESADLINLHATDPVIIAMAKVIVFKATLLTGSNTQARKDRNKAAQIIFERCGGRKTEATRPLLETSYVEPDGMSRSLRRCITRAMGASNARTPCPRCSRPPV